MPNAESTIPSYIYPSYSRQAMDKCFKIALLACVLLIHCVISIYPQSSDYKFRHITTSDGLPTNNTRTVFKDSKGFIWIGTRAGLCRYDGYDITVFRYDPADSSSLSDNNIMDKNLIVEDENGYIWIGTQRGLNRFDPVTEKFTRYMHYEENARCISNENILCLYIDRSGTLWTGAGIGLNRYHPETNDFTVYFLGNDSSIRLSKGVSTIYEDRTHAFWVGTNSGLYKFDREYGDFTAIETIIQVDSGTKLKVFSITEETDGNMLFGTQKGFLKYDRALGKLSPSYPFFNEKANLMRLDLAVDPLDGENTLWVTYNRLFRYDKKSGERAYLVHDPADPASISGPNIISIYFDESGMLWLPSSSMGINVTGPEKNHIQKFPEFVDQYGNGAHAFLKDSRGHLWIDTYSGKLVHFDQDMNPVKVYDSVPVDGKTTLPGFSSWCLYEDGVGNIWVGTNNKGLYYIEHGVGELVKCRLHHYQQGYESTFIYDILEDSRGTLWIAALGGLYQHKKEDPSVSVFRDIYADSSFTFNTSLCIHEDRHGIVWIGTYGSGLLCQPPELIETNGFIKFNHEPGDKHSLSNETVWSIYEDIDGDLWFGTENGLNRFIREENAFELYISETNKGANFIYDLTGDDRGYLWLNTEGGLLKFNPGKENPFRPGNYQYEFTRILPSEDIYSWRIYKAADGEIFVGGAVDSKNGYFRFYPDSIRENRRIPPVFITEFLVRDEKVQSDSAISLKKHIYLNYDQNFFSFGFAALDFADPLKNQYVYYLEGLEDGWIHAGNQRLANYTDVSPGDYIFRVKGSNNDGYWNEEGTNIRLTIFPPPWKTWWAYMSYIVFIVFIFYIVLRYYLRRQKLIHSLELKQVQNEKLEELDSMKSHFFANISHEFRTPLTLILGPLQNLLSQSKDEKSKQELKMIQRNARRLQNLINQLLSLSKLESGQLKLKAGEENIVTLVKQYVQSFESFAKQKKIELIFTSTEDSINLYVDSDKIEKILYNLLSNAFKFTPAGGSVAVEVSSWQSTVGSQVEKSNMENTANCQLPTANLLDNCTVISISDTGSGIAPDKLPHIFDRFYQADNSYSNDQEGTGIGLAIVKELVEIHHGMIKVESGLGKGTTFWIFLPEGKAHLNADEIDEKSDISITKEESPMFIPEIEFTSGSMNPVELVNHDESEEKDDKPYLLIVDDNTDLRAYIRGYLERDYYILEAKEGVEGFKMATEKIPDLVVSDVMMSGMDGYELCRKLKSDERTSHIPVILLTAWADLDSKIEGLKTGADDFIIKPFDRDELQVRVENLINQRRKLNALFSKKLNKYSAIIQVDFDDSGITSMDEQFLKKVMTILAANFSDPEFNVEELGRAVNMSRIQFYRKFRALTGLTAVEFIRSFRLQRAADLIAKQCGTISEIAYDVGFSSPSYFTECFKKQFGVLPTDYASLKS